MMPLNMGHYLTMMNNNPNVLSGIRSTNPAVLGILPRKILQAADIPLSTLLVTNSIPLDEVEEEI